LKEALSQTEIDQILTGIMTGSQSAREKYQESLSQEDIKFYDFGLPNKFSKGNLQTLQMLHENFSRLISSFLSGYLRTNVQLRVSAVEQLIYDDFIRSIPTPVLITIFSMNPLKGKGIMALSPQFVFPVIDLLFGGPGIMPKRIRHFTDIEISILRRLNTKILDNLAAAWSDVFPVEPEIESMETNPLLHQVAQRNEIMALLTFDGIIGGSGSGVVTICFPHVLLEPVIAQMSASYRNTVPDEDEARSVSFWLERSDVKLTTVAGEVQITVNDFLQLQAGDILLLDRRIGQDMDLYVENKLKFKVQAGTIGQQLGVQILSMVEEVKGNV
jgi:flagellar motor switch protein FliM